MTPAQWKQVDQLFHKALECPPEHRADFLKQTCKGDAALLREVESLLSSHEQAGAFIEKSPSDIAAQFLADERHELPPGDKLGRYEIGAGHPVAERESLVGRQIVVRIGGGTFVGERLSFNKTGAIATIEALYHINGKALQFTAHNYITFDTQKGTAVIKGFVPDGLLKGARVNGEFQAISPCGIINALAGAYGDTCFQGNLVITPGSEN